MARLAPGLSLKGDKAMGMFVNLDVDTFEAEVAEVRDTLNVGGLVTLSEGARVDATAVGGVKVLIKDGDGNALLATGTGVPADTGAGYAKGCLFIDTDVATGTSGLYVNVGTTASCVFKLVTNA
jgi:hypothetical protein